MSIPSYRLIHPQANRCFVLKWEPFGLTTPWHYHPEVELIYFVKGKTTGVIGQGFREFSEGDLVILGADFPHVLQKHSQFAREHPSCKPFGLIVQFRENFLGEDFFSIPEFAAVNHLLKRSRRGIIFGKKVTARLSATLQQLPKMTDSKALITILDILVTLGNTKEYTYLTPKEYTYDHSYDEERMQHINQYIYEHFREQILISDVAKVSNMTETSFCRYFKSRTLKTFTRFLNEVRVSYACKLLNNSDCSITDACFESGYNSLSYFNRQFKSILKMSPLKYKEWKSRAILSV